MAACAALSTSNFVALFEDHFGQYIGIFKSKNHKSFVFGDREEPMKMAKMSAMASPFKIPEAPAELENDTPQHETPGFLLLLGPHKHHSQ